MKNRIIIIKNLFIENYKHSKTELIYKNEYELLVCIMLSAQCTDKRVNLITPSLFNEFPSIQSLSKANLSSIKMIIKSCSFFNNKASNLLKMAQKVEQEFDGKIPCDERNLISLPGVGQKTAHVLLIEYFDANLMAVDTHVFRVSHRLKLSNAKTPEKTEADLTKIFKTDLNKLHQAMVLFGRYICKAVKPLCNECFLYDICSSKDKLNINTYL